MNHEVWLGVAIAVVCFIGIAAIFIQIKQRKPDNGLQKVSIGSPTVREKRVPPTPLQSPLTRITFKNALEGDGLGPATQTYGQDALNYSLAGQGANFVIQAIELGERQRTLNITYRFTDKGYRLLREKTVTIPTHTDGGQWLPVLKDRHGHFTELAKGHKDVLGKLANVSSLVIAAAHIIVSIDTLHRLKRIESRLDQLLTGRRNDQLAKLERLYVRGGEVLLCLSYGETSPELGRYRDELYDLRSGWRREIEGIVQSAQDPTVKAWWNNPTLKKTLRWTPPGMVITWSEDKVRTKREKALFDHLLPLVDIVRCIRLALLIDVCIAQWDGSADVLFSHTLRSEAELWGGIGRKLDEHIAKFERHDEAPYYIEVAEATGKAIRSYVAAITGENLEQSAERI